MYILKQTDTGYKFDVMTDDGKKLATSEVYSTVAAAANGIASAVVSAAKANIYDTEENLPKKRIPKLPRFEYFKDAEGGQRYRYVGSNGKILYSSVGKLSKAEIGKWLPGHYPEDEYGYIVVVRNGIIIIILRFRIRNPINPVARNSYKAELASQIKGAYAMSQKLTGIVRPLVIDTELSGIGKNLTDNPGMKPVDIKGFNAREFVKDILK